MHVWMDGVVRGTLATATGIACFGGEAVFLHLRRLSAVDIHGNCSLCLTCEVEVNVDGWRTRDFWMRCMPLCISDAFFNTKKNR